MKRLAPVVAVCAALAIAALVAWCAFDAGRRDLSGLDRRMPPRTSLMAQREREARDAGRPFRPDRRPIPYDAISPLLRRAVLTAEDDAFFQHGGLDWNEIRASARRNWIERRLARGGSTITQQLAKNLFLGTERTPWRKLTEMFLALRLENALSKRRIFELYLNSIEWGDGIFGIEAAAERHFGVSASSLSPRQSVLLAAVIINPRRYSPTTPSARIERRARIIASRMHARGFLTDHEYREAIGEAPPPFKWWPFDWFGGPPADTTAARPDTEAVPEIAPADSDTALAPR
jgi:monofunctional biosynthetic peptidoglycan transglycosylase